MTKKKQTNKDKIKKQVNDIIDQLPLTGIKGPFPPSIEVREEAETEKRVPSKNEYKNSGCRKCKYINCNKYGLYDCYHPSNIEYVFDELWGPVELTKEVFRDKNKNGQCLDFKPSMLNNIKFWIEQFCIKHKI